LPKKHGFHFLETNRAELESRNLKKSFNYFISTIRVNRISFDSALSRAAWEVRERGIFTFADEAVSYKEISAIFEA
jgi:hypothetical protein